MKAIVICANDSVKAVTFDKALVKDLIEELALADFEAMGRGNKTYQDYRDIVYWHTHEVEFYGKTSIKI